jgi:hypothetical protein
MASFGSIAFDGVDRIDSSIRSLGREKFKPQWADENIIP